VVALIDMYQVALRVLKDLYILNSLCHRHLLKKAAFHSWRQVPKMQSMWSRYFMTMDAETTTGVVKFRTFGLVAAIICHI
jgi:hypothetical protein